MWDKSVQVWTESKLILPASSGKALELTSIANGEVIVQGVVRLRRVRVICPACGQEVQAVAKDGRVKGYCGVARQVVDLVVKRRGILTDEEFKAKVSAAIKKRWQDPEYRARQSAARQRFGQDPGYRARQRARVKKLWQDPAYRAKVTNALKKRWQDPEYQAKVRNAITKRWQDPDYRRKIAMAVRGEVLTTEQEAEISTVIKS